MFKVNNKTQIKMLAGFIVNFELIQHIIQYPNWLHQKALKGLKGNGFFKVSRRFFPITS